MHGRSLKEGPALLMKGNPFRLIAPIVSGVLCFNIGSASAESSSSAIADAPESVTVVAQAAQAKTITVKGIVKDLNNEPITGARVSLKGNPAKGAATNIDGRFELRDVPADGTLIISFVGMETQEIAIKGQTNLNIILSESQELLDEVVVTAFGTGQKKASMVGSVQTVRPAELKVPAQNLSASFAGRLAGVISVQRRGTPGADGADFWIRGISSTNASNPLIILDGVSVSAADLNALDPEVIEGFSILKDATATALYGSRGANGVVIVTTKTGANLDKPVINVRVEGYMNTPTKLPEFVDGVEFMKLYNEALINRSTGDLPYTQDKILGTAEGRDIYAYPNVDWYNTLFRKATFNQKANVNIRGGGKKLDYFMSVTADHQTGMLKGISKNYSSYDNQLNVYRYAFQNNIRLNFTETSSLALRLNAQIGQSRSPAVGIADIFGQVIQSNPVDFPITFPEDGVTPYIKWGSKSIGAALMPNPVATASRGYADNFNSTVIANLEFNQDLKMVTPGLRFSALASFKNWASTSTSRSKNNNFFQIENYSQNEDGTYTVTPKILGDEVNTTLGSGGGTSGDRRIYFHTMLLWDRAFGDHNLGAMINYNQEETAQNVSNDNVLNNLPRRKQGLAGRLTYSYDNRYVLEANFGYNGSENFAKGHRFGFFPSIALGYNVSEEKYWEPIKHIFPLFKLRGSYGLVGNDAVAGERFVYMSKVNLQGGPGYTTGLNQSYSLSGPKYERFENNAVTWEVGYKTNVGLDLQVLKGFRLNLDLFHELRTNVFQQRNTIPKYMGAADTKLYGNLAEISNRGIDASLEYNHQFGRDFWMNVRGTFTYAHNRIEKWDEAPFMQYPQRSMIGQSLNTHIGYIAERLFIDQADIDNSPKQVFADGRQPGDIKYKDLPDRDGKYDGKIDQNDRRPIGYPTVPEIVYGFGTNMRYKFVDFGIFFQGVGNSSMQIYGFHPFGKQANRNVLKFIADDHWTPENQNIYAAYPRLVKEDWSNNTVASTYWMRDASFLKLKNIELGFNYKNARVYLSGQNLLTFSKFKLWDPEMGGGNGLAYPTQKTFNVGLQLTFN